MDGCVFLFFAHGKPLNSPILMASNLMHICIYIFLHGKFSGSCPKKNNALIGVG